MLYYSFGSGITIRVAHFYGQSDWLSVRRTARAGTFILLGMAFLSSFIFLFAGEYIIRAFTSDPLVQAMALTLILPLILYQLGDSMQICFANALRGTSHVMSMMWIAFLATLLSTFLLVTYLHSPYTWALWGYI